MNKLSPIELRESAVKLIAFHVGAVTAKMYDDLYKRKSPEYVYSSILGLLTELLGSEKARQELHRLSITRL